MILTDIASLQKLERHTFNDFGKFIHFRSDRVKVANMSQIGTCMNNTSFKVEIFEYAFFLHNVVVSNLMLYKSLTGPVVHRLRPKSDN